jgi:hypothetical protein
MWSGSFKGEIIFGMPLNNGTMFRLTPTQAKGAQEVSLCAPVPSQGVPARGRVAQQEGNNAIAAASGRGCGLEKQL